MSEPRQATHWQLADFDFDLPPERIANVPARPRDTARLMRVNRESGLITHHRFLELPTLLAPTDLLVLNNTRVRPARLYGRKAEGSAALEVLFVNSNPDQSWDVLIKHAKRVRPGSAILFPDGVRAIAERRIEELYRIRFELDAEELHRYLEMHALPAVPPYIKGYDSTRLRDDYQTIYAKNDGAIAAPTAGFHFTDGVFRALDARGIRRAFVTLHVGLGTFQPVREESVAEHRMHAESFELPRDAADQINESKMSGHRVLAVGTTSTRVLETCADHGLVTARAGTTDLFIVPGDEFRIVDALITNFHLPKSTLLMLVCAFANRELIFRAYAEAIEAGYRFYSFGDAMLIE